MPIMFIVRHLCEVRLLTAPYNNNEGVDFVSAPLFYSGRDIL
jgi:hypothetical protein